MNTNTIALYADMKEFVPSEKIINSVQRFNPELSKEEIENRFDALMQWFATIPIALSEGKLFQMIDTVDVVWHAFILHTQDYANFCNKFYNGFLNHEPPENYDESRKQYAEYTLMKLKENFGDKINLEFENLRANVKCCMRGHTITPN